MRDKGLVVSTQDDFARVEVQCFIESCHDCSARSLCLGQDKKKGLLVARNPLEAQAGDEVEVDIPETKYNQALILLFGVLLSAAILGMGAGYFLSLFLSFSSSMASFSGLLLALIIAGGLLFRHFHKDRGLHLYPEITSILKRGG
jgi:positive regulator of sigma E activity